jgi:hypothetical protein
MMITSTRDLPAASVTQYTESWFHSVDASRSGRDFRANRRRDKAALIVVCLYFALGAYVRRKQPAWSGHLEKRRLAIVLVLVLVVSAIKVSEDVLGGESGPIDKAILLFIRGQLRAG